MLSPRRYTFCVLATALLVSVTACTPAAAPQANGRVHTTAEAERIRAQYADQPATCGPEDGPESKAVAATPTWPTPVGGLQYIQLQVRYSEQARRAKVEGTVLVEFIVNRQGRPIDVYVKQGLGAGLDEEAVRAVKATQFQPALLDGEPVCVRFQVPIRFRG